MFGVMITDGGTHSAEKWAEATASHIVQIADHMTGERRAAAVRLQAAVIDVLEEHHTTVQNGERAKLSATIASMVDTPLDADSHVSIDSVVAEIVSAAGDTPWAEDFTKPEMQEQLTILLSQHFRTSMDIERKWHADRNAI